MAGIIRSLTTARGLLRIRQRTQRLGVRRARDAAFGDDGGDVARRSYVETWMRRLHIGRDANVLDVNHFVGRSFFDGNVAAIGNRQVESRNRRGDVKRHVVFFREHRDLIRADFVRGVAVRSDAVGAGDDRSDGARLQKVADHVVGDERERDAAFVEFPRGEARALKIRARFGNEDVKLFALLDRNAKDAERRADACRRERARVALRHHAAFAGHEFGAETAHRFVGRFLLKMDLLRLRNHCGANFIEIGSLRCDCGELRLHAIDRPEKIDRRRARLRENRANLVELRALVRRQSLPSNEARRSRRPSPRRRRSPALRE